MARTLAAHLQEKLSGEPERLGWFVRRFTRLARIVSILLRRKQHRLGTFKAVGFPVSEPQRLSDGALVFELFVFDAEADGERFETPVGVRARCLVPARAYGPAEEVSSHEELDLAGEVWWMGELGGYVLNVTGLQVLSRS